MQTIRLRSIGLMLAAIILAPALTAQQSNSAVDDGEDLLALQNQMPAIDSEAYAHIHQVIELDLQNATLEEALTAIAGQADLKLMYRKALLPKDKKVSYNNSSMTVYDALWEVLDGTGIQFAISQNRQLVLLKMRDVVKVYRQELVRGQIIDSQTGEALPGVNILVEGTGTGTTTDSEGNFELEVEALDVTLIITYIGYERVEMDLDGRTELFVEMTPSILAGEELLVIGYGTQIREEMSSSVSSVDVQSFENITVSHAATALQGTVSGLRVQRSGGQPGAEPTIVMRGGASILNPNGAEPLYVVDGVTRPNLAGINSSDIESMQVLKDASATAIYGARAANGVVIINTKRGEAGITQFNYNYSANFSQLREKLPLLNGEQHIYYGRIGAARRLLGNEEGIWQGTTPSFIQQWFADNPGRLDSFTDQHGSWFTGNDLTNQTSFTTQYLSAENEHLLQEGWQTMQDPLDPSREIIYMDTDWQDVIFRTGVTHDHHLNVSGGTEAATFNAGLGYSTIDGTAIQTYYDRISANLRGDLQIRDNVSINSSLNFSRETDNEVFSNNALFERSISLAPSAKRTFQDGTPAHYRRSLGNPEYYMPRTDVDNLTDTYSLRAQLNWEILPGLSFDPSVSLYTRTGEEHTFLQSYFDDGSLIATRNSTGVFTNFEQQEYDAVLNYVREVALDHNVEATLGSSYFERSSRNIVASGTGAATDLIPTLNAAADPSNISSFRSDRRIIGFFSRVNYNYARRYLLTFTSRYDGASNLGPANKWGYFPGISAGWNLHNEDFWTNPLNISTLKLRASYGTSGNLGALGDFTAQGGYSVGNTYAGQPAIQYSTIANEDLRWEQSRTFNLGFETGVLSDRIEFQAEVYRRVTDNLVMSLTLPASTGFSSILTNLGSLENRGIEMEFRANILQSADVNWNFSFNASYNENTILSLPENQNENNRIGGFEVWDEDLGELVWKGGLQEGGTMGDMYAFKQVDVYATDEEAAQGPKNTMRLTGVEENYAGDSEFYDADGDGFITPSDRRYMGNIFPDWTGGISTTVSYRNWSLYLRGDYALGHTIYNYVRTQADGTFAGNLNPTTNVLRSWMEPGDQTDVPRFYSAEQIGGGAYWMGDPRNAVGNGSGNSIFYEKGDYFAVREISLIFNAPQYWLDFAGIRGLRLNVTAENLHYFSGYFGLHPEEGGMDRGRYPIPRNISISANISF